MPTIKGRNVSVDIAALYGAPIAVSDVSQSMPAVVSATAHGLAAWSAGYFDNVRGMTALQGQAASVNVPAANSFTSTGLDTSSYAPFVSGSFVPALAYNTLAECTSYDLQVPDGARQDRTTILDARARTRDGLQGQQTVTLNVLPRSNPSDAMALIIAASISRGAVLVRIRHSDGSIRLCRGNPTYPTEGLQAAALGSSSIRIIVDGLFLYIGVAPVVVGVSNFDVTDFSATGFDA